MRTLQIRIDSMTEFGASAVAAMKDVMVGRRRPAIDAVSFNSYDDMHALLSPSRLAIIRALAGQGALSIREVARRVGRDVQAVHRDVTRLINAGIIKRTDEGIRFDYDEIDFAFKVNAAA